MEKLIDAILAFPSSPNLSDQELTKQANALLAVLNKTPAAVLAATKHTDLLAILNPSANSLGYLYALLARLDVGGLSSIESIWNRIVVFLETLDSRQVRAAHNEFRRLVKMFSKHATDEHKSLLAVRPLKKALLRYYPARFSFLHTPFLRLCLEAKCYRDALSILDIDLLEFPSVKNKEADGHSKKEVRYQDLLLYFLYGGMIYMGMKEWRRAADFLTYAVGCPGSACSAIQVDAYKKYILVGLLLDGKPLPMPKVTSAPAARSFKALTKAYDTFATAFKSGTAETFRQEASLLADVFKADGTTGLAVQCMDAFRRARITELRDTYVTLSVVEISNRGFEAVGRGGQVGGVQETEEFVLGMIERDEIRASLSHTPISQTDCQTTVHFHNNPTSELRNLRALESQIMRTVALTNQAKAMDRKLGLSVEYIQYVNKLGKSGGGPGTNAPSGALMSMAREDSDMMDYDYAGGGEYGSGGGWADDDGGLGEETVMQDVYDEEM